MKVKLALTQYMYTVCTPFFSLASTLFFPNAGLINSELNQLGRLTLRYSVSVCPNIIIVCFISMCQMCMRACMRACVRACVCSCVCVCLCNIHMGHSVDSPLESLCMAFSHAVRVAML